MPLQIAQDDPAILDYHQRLKNARSNKDSIHEGNIRHAFANLLEATARKTSWTLVQEHSVRVQGAGGQIIRYDGMLRDDNSLPHGYWEAKDSDDDLELEIERKRERKYSFKNIIFEDSREAVLYQGGYLVTRIKVDDAPALADLLTRFYKHEIKPFDNFNAAIDYFKIEIPHIANGLKDKILAAHESNKSFKSAFAEFLELCKTALNPNIRKEAVDEMLIQHILTERLIRRVFDVDTFSQRNVIAAEIEKVINALSSQHFNRKQFLGSLDHIYKAIEDAADEVDNFTDKQRFLNTVYERFFQGYSVKVADTHGIVYTPQEIVDFMCAAVEEVLKDEFNLHLGDPEVKIIDPATGTGNFIVNLLNRVDVRDIDRFYREQLFANEVMLMPYYIASLNIEHAYYERTGRYEPFEGISFVDTLDLAEGKQMRMSFMTEKNTARVERQKKAEINVIIGNPPYNVGQLNENDNNKNRVYEVIDQRVKETYVKDSNASNKNSVYDAYVKFFRWATDRLGNRDGVVCFVSNNGFADNLAFDGMRKHLMQDFNQIYVVDLKGNVRKDSMREGVPIGEEHTVFGLAAMVGISVTILVRKQSLTTHSLFYTAADWKSKRVEKFKMLASAGSLKGLDWQELIPNAKYTWLVADNADEFESFIPLGDKDLKSTSSWDVKSIFKTFSGGLKSNRDVIVYDFAMDALENRMQQFINDYNAEVDRYKRTNPKPTSIDDFVDYSRVVWSRDLKLDVKRGNYAEFSQEKIRRCFYRPFTRRFVFFDRILNEEIYILPSIFPHPDTETENRVIVVSDKGYRATQPTAFMTDLIPELHLSASSDGHQCFSFYIYDENKSNRHENITDWALEQFRVQYGDASISKWDIFYYVYGLLHHPAYRERYADNLKRELPRIPFVPGALTLPHVDMADHPSPTGEGLAPSSPWGEEGRGDEGLNTPLRLGEKGQGDEGNPTRLGEKGQGDEGLLGDEGGFHAMASQAMVQIARELRQRQTPAEQILWEALRSRRLASLKFRRQHPIANTTYAVDFFCYEANLAIELDGEIHKYQAAEDAQRQSFIEEQGWTVLRFDNRAVYDDLESVLVSILETAQSALTLNPSPAGEGLAPLLLGEKGQGDEGLNTPLRLGDADDKGKNAPLRLREKGQGDEGNITDEGLSGFWAFATAGRKLADLHLNYETIKPYRLTWEIAKTSEGKDKPIVYRVEKMRLKNKLKSDTPYSVYARLQVNEVLTLADIPAEAFAYRLGNRSALEWVVDQYQVKTDKRSGIKSDPNAYSEDERYIVDLVEKVVQVSVETVKIVNTLSALPFRED